MYQNSSINCIYHVTAKQLAGSNIDTITLLNGRRLPLSHVALNIINNKYDVTSSNFFLQKYIMPSLLSKIISIIVI